jgi:nuclear transport factor 2 (NTF2) superfamily protein
MTNTRPLLPPFSVETAALKARLAEDAWNSRDPYKVTLAHTLDSEWRNCSEFYVGRKDISTRHLENPHHRRRKCVAKPVRAHPADGARYRFFRCLRQGLRACVSTLQQSIMELERRKIQVNHRTNCSP